MKKDGPLPKRSSRKDKSVVRQSVSGRPQVKSQDDKDRPDRLVKTPRAKGASRDTADRSIRAAAKKQAETAVAAARQTGARKSVMTGQTEGRAQEKS